MLGDSVLGRMAEARATGPTCGRFPLGTLDFGNITTSLGTVFLLIPKYNSATLPAWLGVVVFLGVLIASDLTDVGTLGCRCLLRLPPNRLLASSDPRSSSSSVITDWDRIL